MNEKTKHIYWHNTSVTIEDRWKKNGYKSCLLWFTGLSASGKSSIAHALCKLLYIKRVSSYVLDGDNIRHSLNKDLGLSPEDRKENIRRVGEVAKLFIDAGLITLAAFISPYREDRMQIRKLLGKGQYIEVFVKCPFSECEKRDPKGVYKKAKAGEIQQFTGLSAPYEEPEDPEMILDTNKLSEDECVKVIFDYLIENKYLKSIK